MDLILIAGNILVIVFMTWFAWRVGEDRAARMYQAELATIRAKNRRIQRDLDAAHDEASRLRRRAGVTQPEQLWGA
jgi:hypothetical protein